MSTGVTEKYITAYQCLKDRVWIYWWSHWLLHVNLLCRSGALPLGSRTLVLFVAAPSKQRFLLFGRFTEFILQLFISLPTMELRGAHVLNKATKHQLSRILIHVHVYMYTQYQKLITEKRREYVIANTAGRICWGPPLFSPENGKHTLYDTVISPITVSHQ